MELGDETFCQIVKELQGNPDPKSREQGWALLQFLLDRVLPSPILKPSVEAFIRLVR